MTKITPDAVEADKYVLPSDADLARYWSKVDKRAAEECWEWLASKRVGYGVFSMPNKQGAHRLGWEIANLKTFPFGKMALHSCDNRGCVNPSHIRPGTAADNAADASLRGRKRGQERTHCINGHPFAGDNLAFKETHIGKKRVCVACQKIYRRRAKANLRRKLKERRNGQ